MGEGKTISYEPTPTAALFHASPKDIRGIRGPVGSGKSVAMVFDIFFRSMMQVPCDDGVIRNRWLVLRNTLPELRDTTIKTLLDWFPDVQMNWTPPYHGTLILPHVRDPKVKVEIEMIFMGCQQPNFEEKLKSLELTGVWANEASQIRWAVLREAYGRCGRYPSMKNGGPFHSFGLIMDTNSPDDQNWWYKFEVVQRPPMMDFFVQPPALLRVERNGVVRYVPNRGQDLADPRPAENWEHHSEQFDYWLKQTVGGDEEYIRRYILNQFGTSMEGMPVYPEWKESVHYTRDALKVDLGMPVIIGTDFGRTPASIIGQMTTDGRMRILDEVVTENIGVLQYAQEVLRPLLVKKYGLLNGARVVNFCDPAGAHASQEDDNVTCIQRMNEGGIYSIPCPYLESNNFTKRRECVADLLRMRLGDKPGLIVGSNCQTLRKGFNGGYCYKRVKGYAGGSDIYTNSVDKHNPFSHPHDALQYLCWGALHGGERYDQPNGSWFNPGAWGGDGGASIDLGGFGV